MEALDVYGLVDEGVVEHLRQSLAIHNIHDEHVEVSSPEPGRYRLHDEVLHRDSASARRGLVVGGLVGIPVGLVVAVIVPQVSGALEVLATTMGFVGFGGLVGGMAGLQRAETNDDDPVRHVEVTPGDGRMLVQVHHEHWHNRAHQTMERHGVVFLDDPAPVSRRASVS